MWSQFLAGNYILCSKLSKAMVSKVMNNVKWDQMKSLSTKGLNWSTVLAPRKRTHVYMCMLPEETEGGHEEHQ
jgi:hypothetical protein